MRALKNIGWLGTKELRSILTDKVLVVLILYSFSLAIYSNATAISESVNNASIAIIDEDQSSLSRAIANAFYPPYFNTPEYIEADQVDTYMDQDTFMFVVSIPPHFEKDVRGGQTPEVKIDIDATAVTQASLGNAYIQSIITQEINYFASRSAQSSTYSVSLAIRRAFNPNGTGMWFSSINALLNQITLLTMVLTGAALLREREHGTIEHLLTVPLSVMQIVAAKIWANSLVIVIAFILSLTLLVEYLLAVPVAGSHLLLLLGTILYVLVVAAIGILLGTVAKTMAQFSLLVLLLTIPMMMLSGGMTPVQSQPEVVQAFTWLLPSRHYMSFTQAVVFRGAGINIVWPELILVSALGVTFLTMSLALFRRSLSAS
ncbi:ABC transporter permease [Glaciecola sp. XM2]|jgi:ABC-2 type transport system permease protein|uniref:ABC transporter permease n=1 Tax=Glaciecola sp. XM2 TaxID=1914931 RepID=UPI001BDF2AD9|nr:ABC transporter permease [Glaciecola sp. XM2]MBT1450049.1 ABC transporter permease [Glaciecola sp. XM2]